MFPLIQLPRKSEGNAYEEMALGSDTTVSINSTSEEVRSTILCDSFSPIRRVSINSTSEEVRSLGSDLENFEKFQKRN